jgi:hypothetical protein
MKRKVAIGCAVAVGVGLLSFAIWVETSPLRAPGRMERIARAMVGHAETELVEALGQPAYVVSAATLAGRSVDYPWKGMNFVPVPTRPVRNKVLLYSKWDVAIYVYIDEHNIVEFVAAAKT